MPSFSKLSRPNPNKLKEKEKISNVYTSFDRDEIEEFMKKQKAFNNNKAKEMLAYNKYLPSNIATKSYLEGYYDAINSIEVTDVFKNFEDEYGDNNTTELTTFKDMTQMDRYPYDIKDRVNMFNVIAERNKKLNYIKENSFEQGYSDALNEKLSDEAKTDLAALGITGAVVAGSHIARKIRNKRANNMKYIQKQADKKRRKTDKQYEYYKKNGGNLSREDFTNKDKRDYEIHQKTGGKMSEAEFLDAKRKAIAIRKKREDENLERRKKIAEINHLNSSSLRNRQQNIDWFFGGKK